MHDERLRMNSTCDVPGPCRHRRKDIWGDGAEELRPETWQGRMALLAQNDGFRTNMHVDIRRD